MYCNMANLLSQAGALKITEAFVYSFSDCVDVCSSYNTVNGGSNCTVAAYQASTPRPANCWLGHMDSLSVGSQGVEKGTDVAVLEQ